ncbi:hypothetical protein [Nisaea sediminum]|uniref:hypothetical protein n=1 Tax=Nisaea sediminum TaxID=2775867 RepID=UPI00186796F7|nr:hypothetical protein [Nisaea sediminum]
MIFLFVRHLVDLDHFTPLAYALGKSGRRAALVTYTANIPTDDFRLSFLETQAGVEVVHLAADEAGLNPNLTIDEIFQIFSKSVFEELFNPVEGAVFVHEREWNAFTERLEQISRERGVPMICAPAYAETFINFLQRFDVFDQGPLKRGYAGVENFRAVISPGGPIDERLERSFWPGKRVVLGSPRFSLEWIDVLRDIAPPAVIGGREGNLRLAIFMRNRFYPVFWSELFAALKLMLRFPNVSIAIVGHIRKGDRSAYWDPLFGDVEFPFPREKFQFGKNSEIFEVAEGTAATRVMEWADCVLNMGTSVVMEAVALRKPVFSLDNLHSNVTVTARYLPSTHIGCRDDLLKVMLALVRNRESAIEQFYDTDRWTSFVRVFLGEGDVLARYSDYFDEARVAAIGKD